VCRDRQDDFSYLADGHRRPSIKAQAKRPRFVLAAGGFRSSMLRSDRAEEPARFDSSNWSTYLAPYLDYLEQRKLAVVVGY
jgi:hypothetical protein